MADEEFSFNADNERTSGVDLSDIGNVNTRRGNGAKSTSTLASARSGGEQHETGDGNRVSVDPSDLAGIVAAMVADALKEQHDARGTPVDPVADHRRFAEEPLADLASTVSALVAKALKDKLDTRGAGRSAR